MKKTILEHILWVEVMNDSLLVSQILMERDGIEIIDIFTECM